MPVPFYYSIIRKSYGTEALRFMWLSAELNDMTCTLPIHLLIKSFNY